MHSDRYLDPDAPSFMGRRMKELRYSRKANEPETAQILRAYELEGDEKTEGAWKRQGTTVEQLAKELKLALQYPEGASL